MYLIRNISRSPEAHTVRASRKGRWTGFLLGSGARIRRKGPRYTEVDESTLRENLEEVIWGVEDGYIEVLSSDEKQMSLESLKGLRTANPVSNKDGPAPEKVSNDPDIRKNESDTKPNDPDNKTKEAVTDSSTKPMQVFSKKRHIGA